MTLFKTGGGCCKKQNKLRLFAALTAIILIAFALSGCAKKPVYSGEIAIVEVPNGTPAPAVLDPDGTETPGSLEDRIRAGYVHPLNGGEPLEAGWPGESVDIDSDGVPELIDIRDIDGCPTVCINGRAFMTDGSRVLLASPDGNRIMFLQEKAAPEEGYIIFYPDESGGTYCRIYAVSGKGRAEDLTPCSSLEQLVRSGLDLMLFNPAAYSSFTDERRIDIDMDGDGVSEHVVFDSVSLSINGCVNTEILSTAMPRFVYDAETNAILLCGSAGDYTLRLRFADGELHEQISYTSLL